MPLSKDRKQEIIDKANEQDSMLIKFGGGTKDIEIRTLETDEGLMVIVHLLVDCRDAMGANAVNTMAEAVTPIIEECASGNGRVLLRIISNLATHRLARAEAVFDMEALGGKDVVEGIMNAYAFADADPYRASTHNKGVMNGIAAVVRATGNDTRAVEAGAHTFAAISGSYKPLTRFKVLDNGDLHGEIELPMAIGTVGGATKVHPTAKLAVKLTGIQSAAELGELIATVGLAQNLAALKALSTEGIQRGHMSLHAKNIAVQAGARPDEIDLVVKELLVRKAVREDVAREVLETMRAGE